MNMSTSLVDLYSDSPSQSTLNELSRFARDLLLRAQKAYYIPVTPAAPVAPLFPAPLVAGATQEQIDTYEAEAAEWMIAWPVYIKAQQIYDVLVAANSNAVYRGAAGQELLDAINIIPLPGILPQLQSYKVIRATGPDEWLTPSQIFFENPTTLLAGKERQQYFTATLDDLFSLFIDSNGASHNLNNSMSSILMGEYDIPVFLDNTIYRGIFHPLEFLANLKDSFISNTTIIKLPFSVAFTSNPDDLIKFSISVKLADDFFGVLDLTAIFSKAEFYTEDAIVVRAETFAVPILDRLKTVAEAHAAIVFNRNALAAAIADLANIIAE